MPAASLRYLNTPAPLILSLLFVATTAATAWLLWRALCRVGIKPMPYWLAVATWLGVQAGISWSGFYQQQLTSLPPRLVLGAVLPTVALLMGLLMSGVGRSLLRRLPPARLVDISLVRIPVEAVLYGLAVNKLVPEVMTFTGRNFDIVAGLTAGLVGWLLRREQMPKRALLIWHLGALALLLFIVRLAVLAVPSPLQQLDFEQPNVAVLRFPFEWLVAFVVPVVLLSHLAGLLQLPGRPAAGAMEHR